VLNFHNGTTTTLRVRDTALRDTAGVSFVYIQVTFAYMPVSFVSMHLHDGPTARCRVRDTALRDTAGVSFVYIQVTFAYIQITCVSMHLHDGPRAMSQVRDTALRDTASARPYCVGATTGRYSQKSALWYSYVGKFRGACAIRSTKQIAQEPLIFANIRRCCTFIMAPQQRCEFVIQPFGTQRLRYLAK